MWPCCVSGSFPDMLDVVGCALVAILPQGHACECRPSAFSMTKVPIPIWVGAGVGSCGPGTPPHAPAIALAEEARLWWISVDAGGDKCPTWMASLLGNSRAVPLCAPFKTRPPLPNCNPALANTPSTRVKPLSSPAEVISQASPATSIHRSGPKDKTTVCTPSLAAPPAPVVGCKTLVEEHDGQSCSGGRPCAWRL